MSKNNDVLGRMGSVLCVIQELTSGDYERHIFGLLLLSLIHI